MSELVDRAHRLLSEMNAELSFEIGDIDSAHFYYKEAKGRDISETEMALEHKVRNLNLPLADKQEAALELLVLRGENESISDLINILSRYS